jgi:D-beta-D-heptose 7-phosphate kinase/D-beta-D-heptose 1-phosphate adenosyltransferase
MPDGRSVVASSRADAASRCRRARAAGLSIVFTNGCFDILHAGHVMLLEAARGLGDMLVVGLNTDESVRGLKGSGRPVMPLASRAACLAALRCVDLVVPFDEPTPASLVDALEPDILVKGGDYSPGEVAGGESVIRRGGRVVIVPLLEGFSSSAAIGRMPEGV